MENNLIGGLNTLVESVVGQERAIMNAKSFPIGEVIEEILNEENLKFQNFPVRGGFDVRLTRGYEIISPLKNAFGREFSLDYLAGRITERYYSRHEPSVIKDRPDLVKPDTLTRNYIDWIISSPEEESSSYAFLDVGAIRALPGLNKKDSKINLNFLKILKPKNYTITNSQLRL